MSSVINTSGTHGLFHILRLNNEQKQIADELMAIFVQNDCIAIEKIDALNLPNFAKFGGLIPCARIMGGKQTYLQFINALINKLYEE